MVHKLKEKIETEPPRPSSWGDFNTGQNAGPLQPKKEFPVEPDVPDYWKEAIEQIKLYPTDLYEDITTFVHWWKSIFIAKSPEEATEIDTEPDNILDTVQEQPTKGWSHDPLDLPDTPDIPDFPIYEPAVTEEEIEDNLSIPDEPPIDTPTPPDVIDDTGEATEEVAIDDIVDETRDTGRPTYLFDRTAYISIKVGGKKRYMDSGTVLDPCQSLEGTKPNDFKISQRKHRRTGNSSARLRQIRRTYAYLNCK